MHSGYTGTVGLGSGDSNIALNIAEGTVEFIYDRATICISSLASPLTTIFLTTPALIVLGEYSAGIVGSSLKRQALKFVSVTVDCTEERSHSVGCHPCKSRKNPRSAVKYNKLIFQIIEAAVMCRRCGQ